MFDNFVSTLNTKAQKVFLSDFLFFFKAQRLTSSIFCFVLVFVFKIFFNAKAQKTFFE